MFNSPAEVGNLGCSLWISLLHPCGVVDSQPLYFLERHCKPLQATPRLLAVAIDAPHLAIVVLVAHAPHAADAASRRGDFWEEVSRIHEGWGGGFIAL
eukprot:3374823-Pyramimonas_sp.AAC.1